MSTRADLVAALFSPARLTVGELARKLEASPIEVEGFYCGLRHLAIVDREDDVDGGIWERTQDAPATPLAMLHRIGEAGIDVTTELRRVRI